MKPICMLHRLTAARSHMGDTSRPMLFSLSPCWQNYKWGEEEEEEEDDDEVDDGLGSSSA